MTDHVRRTRNRRGSPGNLRGAHPPVPRRGLAALGGVKLSEPRIRLLESALQSCGGPPAWRMRKEAEARDLMALSEIAPRFSVHELDLRETLRVIALMHVPVPLRPDENGQLRIASLALLGISYPERVMREPLPGFVFVQILEPREVWHANVSAEVEQLLCLGAWLPAGIQLREIVLMTYGALSMQTVMIDETDPAGVINLEASRWWQHNVCLTPLTDASFLSASQPVYSTEGPTHE